MAMAPYTFIATSAFGLEAVVARELAQLGFEDTKTENGYVEFQGDASAMVKANLWLRCADRVLLKLGQFQATTFEELFEGTKSLPWSDFMPKDATFPVEGRSVKSQLSSVPACQSIVKKAIVESLKQTYKLETFPETGPMYRVEVSILKDEATLTLDTSGPALHKRGYRKLSAAAPIKETLAAALVLLSRWLPHRPFADPLCGSGTIPIEAALIGRNQAPGLKRTFISEQWGLADAYTWQIVRDEAWDAIRTDIDIDVFGSDVDAEVLSLAEYHARTAGVGEFVRLKQADVFHFKPDSDYGCLVTNPPYGERLGERKVVEDLYRVMGKRFAELPTWSAFVITSHEGFERLFGKRADKKRKLYNGRIQTNFYQYLGPLPPRPWKTDATSNERSVSSHKTE